MARPPAPGQHSWDWWLEQVDAYAAVHDTADVPTTATTAGGNKLGRWVDAQRQRHKNGRLSAERVTALQARPGWRWGVRQYDRWWANHALLSAWAAEHGRLPAVRQDSDPTEASLASWSGTQRAHHRAGRLRQDKAAALSALPRWHWTITEPPDWSKRAAELRSWSHAHPRAPVTNSTTGLRWVSTLRDAHRDGRLERDVSSVLDGIPGWDRSVSDQRWRYTLEALQDWVSTHPTGRVKQKDRHRGVAIGLWVGTQRRRYRAGLLTDERVRALEALPGWSWNYQDSTWHRHYGAVRESGCAIGKLARPTTHDGLQIGSWAEAQRSRHAAGQLSDERIALLEQLPGWRW